MSTKPVDLWLLVDAGDEWEIDRPATTADLVAALIAEGGETIWWCEVHKSSGIYRLGNRCCWNGQFDRTLSIDDCHMTERLLGPIPAEEET